MVEGGRGHGFVFHFLLLLTVLLHFFLIIGGGRGCGFVFYFLLFRSFLWGRGGMVFFQLFVILKRERDMGFFVFWKEIIIRVGLATKLTQTNIIMPLWFIMLY